MANTVRELIEANQRQAEDLTCLVEAYPDARADLLGDDLVYVSESLSEDDCDTFHFYTSEKEGLLRKSTVLVTVCKKVRVPSGQEFLVFLTPFRRPTMYAVHFAEWIRSTSEPGNLLPSFMRRNPRVF